MMVEYLQLFLQFDEESEVPFKTSETDVNVHVKLHVSVCFLWLHAAETNVKKLTEQLIGGPGQHK